MKKSFKNLIIFNFPDIYQHDKGRLLMYLATFCRKISIENINTVIKSTTIRERKFFNVSSNNANS